MSTDVVEGGEDPTPREREARSRVRSVSKWLFVVLSTILVLVAALAFWVHSVVFDTDRFMEIVEPAVASDALRTEVADTLSEATIDALDLEARISARLGAVDVFLAEELIDLLSLGDTAIEILSRLDLPRFADLAAPIASALEDRIEGTVEDLVFSDEFTTVVTGTVRRAHTALVAIARGEGSQYENVYVADGEVRLDTLPLVAQAIRAVVEEGLLDGEELTAPDLSDNPRLEAALERVTAAIGERVPDDLGQVTLFAEDRLRAVQGLATTFDRLVWAAIGLAVATMALTIWVAPDRRRGTVQLATAVLLGLGLAGLAITRLPGAILSGFEDTGLVVAVAEVVVLVTTHLRWILLVIAIGAALVGSATYLSGRPPWITRFAGALADRDRPPSELDRFGARYAEALAAAGAGGALVVGWVSDLDPWWTGAAVVAYGVGLWWLFGARARARLEDVAVGDE